MSEDRSPRSRRGRGGGSNKTLIIVLVAIALGAALLGVVVLFMVMPARNGLPRGRDAKLRVECMDNLRQIGALLAERHAAGTLRMVDGPAFLLQVTEDLEDEDLAVFICPGEPDGAAPDRPPIGSPEFIRMYRELTKDDLAGNRDWSRYTSYAGPDLRNFPAGRYWDDDRLWACDRCPDGALHHAGVAVLYATTKVDFLFPEHVGASADGKVIVGPGSPDERLEKMSYGGR